MLEQAKTAAESTASEKVTSESKARKTDDSGGTSAYDAACDADRGKEAIIDKELERSCVEMSERVLAAEAITDLSTAEGKVRQQVEQRFKERKQKKV